MNEENQNALTDEQGARQQGGQDLVSVDRRRARLVTLILALAVLVLVGVAIVVIVVNQPDEPNIIRVEVTNVLPSLRTWEATDFTLESLTGELVSLSDFEGRPVFLNFWATWCAPCRREFPAFERFMAEQPPDGPIIVTVNQAETVEQVHEFLDSLDISGVTVLMDQELDLLDFYPAGNLPTTYLIDPAGFVRFTRYGEVTYDDLYNLLAEVEPGVGG